MDSLLKYNQNFQMFKDRYCVGDDQIEKCFLCGLYDYATEFETIHGESVCKKDCGCRNDLEPDDVVEKLVLQHQKRLNELVKKTQQAVELHPLFVEICNSFKLATI